MCKLTLFACFLFVYTEHTHTQHTVVKCYFVTLHVASRGFNFSLSLTLSSIYCALHTRFIQIKLSPKFHTNAYFVVFCSCAFANLMTHSKHTLTHIQRHTHSHSHKIHNRAAKPIFVLTQSFFVNF